jgi:hypothetical protein
MVAAALALFSMVGAWLAWRRNPLYSAAATLRMMVVIGLSIAALILAIIAATHFSMNRSEPVAVATILGVVILGTLAMVFIVQKVTTPKDARLTTALPAGTKILHVHRRKVYKWLKGLAIFLAACGALAWIIPGDAKFAVYAIGGMGLLVAVMLLPVWYFTARSFDRSLTALEIDPWLHWQYPAAQWRQWTEAQVARTQAKPPTFVLRRDWKKLAWPFGLIAAGVIAFSPGSLLERILYVLFCCGAIAALAWLGAWSERRAPTRMRATLEAAPEVYFGHDGVFCNGVYSPWLGIDAYLTAASVDERPPRSIVLAFEKVVVSPYTANQITRSELGVLIPDGAETDMARLQRELSARCPKARIALA